MGMWPIKLSSRPTGRFHIGCLGGMGFGVFGLGFRRKNEGLGLRVQEE